MKRLVFSIIALGLFCSCSEINYIGTITVLDNDGNAVKRWNNITLKTEVNGYTSMNSFKSFGLNFYDPESKQFIILSKAVPYIIEYNTHTNVEDLNTTSIQNEERGIFLAEREKLINQYNELEELQKAYKTELSKLDKNSEEYNKLKEQIKTTKDKMKEINKTLWYEYNYCL